MRHVAFAFAAFVLTLSPVSADTLTFAPTKDVIAKEKFPSTNFGTDPNLQTSNQTGYRKVTFLQFTVSGIPAGATNLTAQLELRSQTTGTSRPVAVHGVSATGWSETGLTWSNRPALGSTLATVSSHTSGQDSVWAVTAHVTGNGTFALGLDSTFSGDTTFGSRESSTVPSLVINYTVAAPPTVSFSSADWNASEASSGPAALQVISSAAAPAGGLVVHYAISGTAESNHNSHGAPDYILSPANATATTGSVTILAGATSATLTLTPIQDTNFEGNETAVFTITSDAAYNVGSLRKTQIVIADNETAPVPNPDHAVGDAGGWIVPVSGVFPNSECSGMAASRNYPGVAWYHRDGTQNTADPREKLYAIEVSNGTDNGQVIKTIDVLAPAGWSGTWKNNQWEDMAIDPDVPGTIWIGDIGNNANPPTRTDVALFKLTEPNPYGSATSVTPTAYYARYPGGVAANAEVLFIFEGLPHIMLKESNPRIYRSPTATLSTVKASPTILEYVGTLVNGGGNHSVGSLSFDRRRIVLATHNGMWVYASQSGLDPATTTLTPAQAKTYIQDLLCTRDPVWALKHNGGRPDPEAGNGSVEGGCFVGDGHDILFGSEARNVLYLPAWWYETQPSPMPSVPTGEVANNRLPLATLVGPGSGTTFSKAVTSAITLRALAADFDGTVASVQFYRQHSSASSRTSIGAGTLASGQYSATWNISAVATGVYTLSVDATDNAGGVDSHAYTITINP